MSHFSEISVILLRNTSFDSCVPNQLCSNLLSLHFCLIHKSVQTGTASIFPTVIQREANRDAVHFTYPEYKAIAPSSRRIRKKAWNMPRYFKSVKRASIFWPCICRRVLVVSIGNVPVTQKQSDFSSSSSRRKCTNTTVTLP